jgi:hypothetical protein
MDPVAGYKLVPIWFGVGLQFPCPTCGRPSTIKLDDLQGSFTCRQCAKRLTVPSVACFYRASCKGTYVKCGGVIQRLSPPELSLEERKAWQGVPAADARPTDGSLDDARDVRGSIVSYEWGTATNGGRPDREPVSASAGQVGHRASGSSAADAGACRRSRS